MVVDTSALLAILFAESAATKVLSQLKKARHVRMSTVNLCETLVLASDRRQVTAEEVMGVLAPFAIEYVAPDVDCALLASMARLRLPLNFGDCFAYALAKICNEPLLALDGDFAKTDLRVVPGM